MSYWQPFSCPALQLSKSKDGQLDNWCYALDLLTRWNQPWDKVYIAWQLESQVLARSSLIHQSFWWYSFYATIHNTRILANIIDFVPLVLLLWPGPFKVHFIIAWLYQISHYFPSQIFHLHMPAFLVTNRMSAVYISTLQVSVSSSASVHSIIRVLLLLLSRQDFMFGDTPLCW